MLVRAGAGSTGTDRLTVRRLGETGSAARVRGAAAALKISTSFSRPPNSRTSYIAELLLILVLSRSRSTTGVSPGRLLLLLLVIRVVAGAPVWDGLSASFPYL